MIKIIADKKIPFLDGIIEPFAHIQYMDAALITKETVKTADALIIRTRTKCNEELLLGSSVKFIATATIGFDHIDTLFCKSHGITWTNAPGCNANAVQQYIASSLFTLAADHQFQIKNLTIGIVGVGHVGKRVEKLARILGMNVLLNDPPRERKEGSEMFVSLNRLLTDADIITLHVPLYDKGSDKTHHLIDMKAFEKMKPDAMLMNTSRGAVVDPEALKKILLSGKLSGTVLDVWENEPLLDMELLALSTIATPHIAGYSVEGKARGTAIAVEALSRYFGLPLEGWSPQNLPPPLSPDIYIDGNGKTTEAIAREAVLHSYPVMEDDARLRSNPSCFEKQREYYSVRREFPAYKVKLNSRSAGDAELLKELGFNVE